LAQTVQQAEARMISLPHRDICKESLRKTITEWSLTVACHAEKMT
jgi:hypothetical protein